MGLDLKCLEVWIIILGYKSRKGITFMDWFI